MTELSHFVNSLSFNVHFRRNCAGGKLLLELNRLLRPGGFFVWSATPVYQKKAEDVEIWNGWQFLNPTTYDPLEVLVVNVNVKLERFKV